MNILSTIYHLPFSPLQNNAMLWRIVNIRDLLEKHGIHTDLAYFTSWYLREKNHNNDDFPRMSTIRSFFPQYSYLRCLKQHEYDCIYANTSWAGFHSILGKKLNGLPMVVDCHGIPSEEFIMGAPPTRISDFFRFTVLKMVDTWGIRNADLVICVSDSMRDYLAEHLDVPPETMCVIPNGVDIDFFRYHGENTARLKEELGLQGKMVFGYLGGVQQWQGVDAFIRAARRTRSDALGFLLVGGEERYRKGNLVSVPRIPRSEIPHYYSLCDVLVLPRPAHPATAVAAPTKFGEYAAMGKPILTTDVGDASRYVRDYRNGIVVKSADDLERGIVAFSVKDEADLIEMGENSRLLAENEFHWERIANHLVHHLNGVVR